MKPEDVKLGMFLSIAPEENIVVFITGDDSEREAFETVDLHRMSVSFLSYYAVTKDIDEFTGDIDEAKKKTIRSVFP